MMVRFHRIGRWLLDIETNRGKQMLLLAAIIFIATILRFYRLGQWSLWIDEIFTMNRVQIHYGSLSAIAQNIPPARNWFPISLLLTSGVFRLLGATEWSARLVAVLLGVLSIPILYVPIRRLFGASVALIAGLLLAVSPWHLFWSQNARFYTSLLLFYSLALIAFYWAIERDQPKYLIAGMVLLYLATSERIFALFLAPVIACYWLLVIVLRFEKPPGLRLRNFAILAGPVILLALLEGFSFIRSGSSVFFGEFGWFFDNRADDPLRLLSFISYNIGIPLLSIGFVAGVYLISQRSRPGLLVFTASVVPTVLLILMNPFIFAKDRYVFFTLMTWIILGAVAVKELYIQTNGPGRILALGILVLLVADAAGDNLLYFHANKGNRADWRGAFQIIGAQHSEGDMYVTFWPELGEYYLGEQMIAWEEIRLDAIRESGRRYWFVLDSETIWVNPKMKSWVEKNADLIAVTYLRTPDDSYLRVYLYDPGQNLRSMQPAISGGLDY